MIAPHPPLPPPQSNHPHAFAKLSVSLSGKLLWADGLHKETAGRTHSYQLNSDVRNVQCSWHNIYCVDYTGKILVWKYFNFTQPPDTVGVGDQKESNLVKVKCISTGEMNTVAVTCKDRLVYTSNSVLK